MWLSHAQQHSMPSRKSTDLAETRSWAILENGTEGKTVNWHYSLFLKHHHELNAWKTPTEKKKKTCIKKPATTFSSSSVMSKKKEKGILKTLAAVSNPSPESSVYSGSCEQGFAEALLQVFKVMPTLPFKNSFRTSSHWRGSQLHLHLHSSWFDLASLSRMPV